MSFEAGRRKRGVAERCEIVRIALTAHVQADGTLALTIPTGLAESNVEVLVVVQPLPSTVDREQWRQGVLATAGRFADDSLSRPTQGEFESHEAPL